MTTRGEAYKAKVNYGYQFPKVSAGKVETTQLDKKLLTKTANTIELLGDFLKREFPFERIAPLTTALARSLAGGCR